MAKLQELDMEKNLPKSIQALRNYSREKFSNDLIAGVTVGLVALPLAMAFAISSGMSPQAGIYTAIVAGFLSSLLGGSQAQVSGPTGAFVVVVAGIVAKYGVEGLFVCTIIAGVPPKVCGRRVYKWNSRPYCQYTNQRFLWVEN